MVVALVAVSWWGGRRPGIVFCTLVFAVTTLGTPPEPNQSAAATFFGQVSVYALLLFIAVLVSSRKSFERILRDQTDLFSITLASIGDAVITTDAEGLIRFINPTAERLVDRTSADVQGKPLGDIFKVSQEDNGEGFGDFFGKIKRDRTVVRPDNHLLLLGRNGEGTPINNSGAPIIDSSGNFQGAVIVFQDVSEQRAVEDALLASQTRTQQSQKLESIGTLTGGIANDFRIS